jgi:Fe-Mn family superoxide dismutase
MKTSFQLPPLPFDREDLAPYISEKTISIHYGKHHQAYVDNLNRLVTDTALADEPLDKIIQSTVGVPDNASIFNNAAQVWNHSFFWQSMKKHGGGTPKGRLLEMIEKSFGGFENFKANFVSIAVSQFGSGWAWLVQNNDSLNIIQTANAETPIAHGKTPLLTCDVWEHAYYLDYQNKRKDFVEAFLGHLANWEFAESKLI